MLAAGYAAQIRGDTPAERMQSLADLLTQRQIPVSVETTGHGAALTAHACPYPKLAEQDRDICSVERMMFAELLGRNVELTECRIQGGECCRFQTG